jgi:hypothetical protein
MVRTATPAIKSSSFKRLSPRIQKAAHRSFRNARVVLQYLYSPKKTAGEGRV